MVRIYGIKNCDTMKKAFAWLDEHRVEYLFHDYKKSGVPEDRLHAWIATAGWQALVNRRGPTFRKLPAERQQDLDQERAIALMREYSSVIKRPVLETGQELLIGFDPALYAKTLT
jgi:arsenate reductase